MGKGKSRRVFGTAKVGDRGQIVIPKEAREFYQIQPGDTLLLLGDDESGLVITRPEILHDLADKILNHIKEE
ncbi:MAG TPA: AbrB/MazE/SpoVT family DNA-binding domain-containing protein [Candidatus Faecousia gallistercoris]|nr:AbrB/MazE/SpoVT family DNA-binding domain-containing protein [Candidatus Faecousia gallistercoris]